MSSVVPQPCPTGLFARGELFGRSTSLATDQRFCLGSRCDGLEEDVVWAAQEGLSMEKKRFERVFFLCSGLASATMIVAACSADVATSPGGAGRPC